MTAGAHSDDGSGPVLPLGSISGYAAQPAERVPLDATDLRMLLLLSNDARTSQRSLARELGMSPPAVADRLARLQKLGVIEGYGVRLNWSALGYPTVVYLTVTAVHGYEQGRIMASLAALPEVEEVMLVTGNIDMLVRVRVRDHTHLRDLLINGVWQIEGIQRTETSLTIAEMKPKNTASELLTDMIDMIARETGETSKANRNDPGAVSSPGNDGSEGDASNRHRQGAVG